MRYLFDAGCQLVILACNTASAKALRTIQQHDLALIDPNRRVLGVIRPSAEAVGALTQTQSVGVLGTTGTVKSESYIIEIQKLFPHIHVLQQDCPMWVPLVENGEYDSLGADYFIQESLAKLFVQDAAIDTVILGCTHYPLLINKIRQFLPTGTCLVSQGEIVAHSLVDYLRRHPEIDEKCSKSSTRSFLTTDNADIFDQRAAVFFGERVSSTHVSIMPHIVG